MELIEIKRMHNRIVRKEEHVLWLRSIVDSAKSPRLKQDLVQTSIDPQRMSEIMAEVIDEEHELEQMKGEYLELQVKVLDKIESIENDLQRTILKMKYLDFKTLVEISEDTGYSYDHIKRSHKKAVQAYKKNVTVSHLA